MLDREERDREKIRQKKGWGEIKGLNENFRKSQWFVVLMESVWEDETQVVRIVIKKCNLSP